MQLADPANVVLATARKPDASVGLQELAASNPKGRLITLPFDIGSEDSIKAGVAEAEKHLPNGLDYLINNAGGTLQDENLIQDVSVSFLLRFRQC